jgi:flagellar biosynthetic protein FlhB
MLMAYIALYVFKDEALHLDIELYPLNLFHAMNMIEWAFLLLCAAMIPIALIDVPYQNFKHNDEMKMTLQEVKDERKSSEGDPLVKNRVRRLQYQASANRMMQEVPNADVIVTNPTHFAVALKYEEGGKGAPIVVAKGADLMAAQIRNIAVGNGVTLVSAPPLARALFFTTEIDQEVPKGLYLAVAQVLAYVYQLKMATEKRWKEPEAPSDISIPDEYKKYANKTH